MVGACRPQVLLSIAGPRVDYDAGQLAVVMLVPAWSSYSLIGPETAFSHDSMLSASFFPRVLSFSHIWGDSGYLACALKALLQCYGHTYA